MDVTTLNIYPLLEWLVKIVIICAVVVLFYFLKECFFKIKDSKITTNLIDKYPLVTLEFMNKSSKTQNIENNQEIHEINKRIDTIEANQKEILDLLAKLQNKD